MPQVILGLFKKICRFLFSIYPTALRSGGYGMFEDIEDEFDLDTISQSYSDDEEGKHSSTSEPLGGRMSLSQVTSTYG